MIEFWTSIIMSPTERPLKPLPEFTVDHQRLGKLREYGFVPTSILDIGASDGVWSGTCAMIFPEAEYFLIEPQIYPREYEPLQGVKRHWFRQSVGSSEGTVDLIVPEMGKLSKFNAHVLPAPEGSPRSRAPAERVSVPQTTVDHLLESGAIRPPQLVKLDVQGYEAEVLQGASGLWESANVFFVETSLYRYWQKAPLLSDIVALFAHNGFQFYDVSTENRAHRGLLSQLDIIFISEKCEMSHVMDQTRLFQPKWTG